MEGTAQNNPMLFMGYFQVAVCAYIVYSGITQKGQIFNTETIHPSKRDEFKKVIRLFCLAFGPIGLIGGICDIAMWKIPGWIAYGVFFIGVVWLLVKTYGMSQDRVAKKLNQQKSDPYNKKVDKK